jgi:glycosyltransferase involved in cell wall biosynthesis
MRVTMATSAGRHHIVKYRAQSGGMRILIVSDAWIPQTNGVVQTLANTGKWLGHFGHEVRFITPDLFHSLPCPSYPEIRLAWLPYRRLCGLADVFSPDAVHIATEGPLGLAARRYCRKRNLAFTTSYHTQFPQYLRARVPVPLGVSYRLMRAFHGSAARCMVSTPSIQAELEKRRFRNVVRWRRGVDTQVFKPGRKEFLALPRPIAVYVGRLAIEKNIDAFLEMHWHGSKLVVGDGPERARLQRQYPQATFVGYRYRTDLAAHIAASDVMVFPSRTDTFGLVNLEALACGVPVAAFPVPGPQDVLRDGITGALDADLARAADRALALSPDACRRQALQSGWDVCTRQFVANLVRAQAGWSFIPPPRGDHDAVMVRGEDTGDVNGVAHP